MAFKKGEFTITIGSRKLDLSEFDKDEWENIEQFAKFIIEEDPDINQQQAHCAGFLAYLGEMTQIYDFLDKKTIQEIH